MPGPSSTRSGHSEKSGEARGRSSLMFPGRMSLWRRGRQPPSHRRPQTGALGAVRRQSDLPADVRTAHRPRRWRHDCQGHGRRVAGDDDGALSDAYHGHRTGAPDRKGRPCRRNFAFRLAEGSGRTILPRGGSGPWRDNPAIAFQAVRWRLELIDDEQNQAE
jgi:hypothetical protein